MSSSPRFLFLHVMKTGGTSFVFHLLREFPPDAVYPSAALDRQHAADAEPYASVPNLTAIAPERRAAIRMYAGHFPFVVRELIGDDLTTLTILREPVDRTVSVLKQFKRLYERYRDLPLDAIYDDPFVYRHFVENHQTKLFSVTAADHPKMLASRLGFQEFRDHLTATPAPADRAPAGGPDTITVDTHRLARAKSNLARVDVVGLNDRFDEFVDSLRTRFGWWPDGFAHDARANVSSEDWQAGPALRARIAVDNAFDVEFYAYAKELAE
jgi:hypothetical protein